MNRTEKWTYLGRTALTATLATGLILGGTGLAQADRGGRDDRRDGQRYEERYDGNKDGKRFENRHDDRKDGRYERDRRDHKDHKFVRELPRGYKTVRVGHDHYYVHEHRYYRPAPGGYVLVRPPVGTIFATLPLGSVRLTIGGNFFFASDDVYYRPHRGGYIVVESPVPPPVVAGAVVVEAPLLNVRSGPGANFAIIHQVSGGTWLTVTGETPGWYYVALPGGGRGWIMSRFTSPLADG